MTGLGRCLQKGVKTSDELAKIAEEMPDRINIVCGNGRDGIAAEYEFSSQQVYGNYQLHCKLPEGRSLTEEEYDEIFAAIEYPSNLEHVCGMARYKNFSSSFFVLDKNYQKTVSLLTWLKRRVQGGNLEDVKLLQNLLLP